ncbi:hypothetical protein GW950_01750 [Candidatus Wolfebacteria bacterium]|nr:hypothetical protein [Candidatus Wolfebacteria bacterium]
MTGTPEYRPQDCSIYDKCHIILKEDIVILEVREYNSEPEKILLKKGTSFTLVDRRSTLCATEKGLGYGPLLKIAETRGIEIESRYVGRSIVVPTEFLALHPNVL